MSESASPVTTCESPFSDVIPVGVSTGTERAMNQEQISALLKKAAANPVASPEFRVTQRVDYFPLRDGLQPVLPMSAVIEWTGHGRGPVLISIAERVEDPNLAHVILERELRVHWNGRRLSWERDGQLSPGHYLWSIAVHDGQGNIYAYRQESSTWSSRVRAQGSAALCSASRAAMMEGQRLDCNIARRLV